MLELWLIRHGESTWNRENRIQGQSDVPLSELGVRQGEALARRLRGARFDAVFSSDLQRAHHTARLALPAAEVQLDARLREIHFGVLEGKVWEGLEGDEGRILERWREDPYLNRLPQGESYRDLSERVADWLESLPRSGRVAAFAHGGTIRSVLYRFTGQPDGHNWRFFIDNTSISRLVIGERGVIIHSVNDAAHLEGLTLEDG
jgi:probable phosphoglycerate mutase